MAILDYIFRFEQQIDYESIREMSNDLKKGSWNTKKVCLWEKHYISICPVPKLCGKSAELHFTTRSIYTWEKWNLSAQLLMLRLQLSKAQDRSRHKTLRWNFVYQIIMDDVWSIWFQSNQIFWILMLHTYLIVAFNYIHTMSCYVICWIKYISV